MEYHLYNANGTQSPETCVNDETLATSQHSTMVVWVQKGVARPTRGKRDVGVFVITVGQSHGGQRLGDGCVLLAHLRIKRAHERVGLVAVGRGRQVDLLQGPRMHTVPR